MRPYCVPPTLASVTNWPRLAFAGHYRVAAVAKSRDVTVPQFRSYCRHIFGASPKDYLAGLRDEQACHLLMAGHMARAITRLLDFTDASHFCRDFRQRHRMRPRRWLRLKGRW